MNISTYRGTQMTTMGNECSIKNFVEISSLMDLQKTLKFCMRESKKLLILGNGSNLLIGNVGDDYLVAKNSIKGIEISETYTTVYSGTLLTQLCYKLKEEELSGLEWASDIPGTIGGAVIMNAGAYGNEIFDFIHSVDVIDQKGNIRTFGGYEIDYGYRYSGLMDSEFIVLSVRLRLINLCRSQITKKMDFFRSKRINSQPKGRSFGSTFKMSKRNDEEGLISAWKFLEPCNLKGVRVGGAVVSDMHANFILNKENASFDDIVELKDLMKKKVHEEYGISLEEEVIIWNQ